MRKVCPNCKGVRNFSPAGSRSLMQCDTCLHFYTLTYVLNLPENLVPLTTPAQVLRAVFLAIVIVLAIMGMIIGRGV